MRLFIKRFICWVGFGDRLIEFCDKCGVRQPVSWWCANELWNSINGSPYGCICPSCFDAEASKIGVFLVWKPEPKTFGDRPDSIDAQTSGGVAKP